MVQRGGRLVRSFNKDWWVALGLTLLIGGGGGILLVAEVMRRSEPTSVRASQAVFDREVAAVRAGKSKTVRLASSQGTDKLLEQLQDVPGVEGLELDLTDVTDSGMDAVARLRGLRRLKIYGGFPGIGDRGFARLKPLSKLEELQLINTQVTDEGLPVLKSFPRLRDLTLFHEKWRNFTFTPAGLVDLEGLKSLRRLELSGGWASKNDIRALRRALPDCSIDLHERDPAR
jgi:hypothetical protein